MKIDESELFFLKEKVEGSDDPHSEVFKRFLSDLPKIREYAEKPGRKVFEFYKFLGTVCAALRNQAGLVEDKKLKDGVEKLCQYAEALLLEAFLREGYGCSYREIPSALGWSFVRDRTLATAWLENEWYLPYIEMYEMMGSCIPTHDMKEFTVLPYEIPVVVGVLMDDIDEGIKGWLKEQDRVNCEDFFYADQEFGRLYAEEGKKLKHIVTEKKFNEIVSDYISQLYEREGSFEVVCLGIGDGSEMRRILHRLKEKVNDEKYEKILKTMKIIGVDKYRAMSRHSFTTMKELRIRNYEFVEADMVSFKPRRGKATIYLLANNTRNNLDEEKRKEVDENIVKHMKKGDLYIRDEYYPVPGGELKTALEYANYPAIHACLKRALQRGGVALVVQYNPHHPDGGNVEFFSVYREKPVYRIHFRSVRRNIETIRKDGPLLGCNIEIHIDPEEHMVTSVLSKS